MIHIHLVVLGKLKESYWRSAEVEYLKRLQAFAKVTIHELKEVAFSEKDAPDFIKQKEAEKITEQIKKIETSHIFVLEEKGKQFSSPVFAKNLADLSSSHSSFTFVLGGPLGLATSIVKTANATLSLSPLTFTHQMARVILLEQLYRAMMINNNRQYHY